MAGSSRRVASLLIAVLLVAITVVAPAPLPAGAQGLGCIPDPDQNRVEMGTPDGLGNSQHVDFPDPSRSVGFHFSTATPTASLLYIGDEWFDLSLFLYARGTCMGTGGWEKLIRAWSVRAEYRVIQFMRPNEQIVNLLPGEYLMVAQFDPASPQPFDPVKGFTARVATASPYCALDPPDVLQPNPAVPSIKVPRRPDEALYQLGMSIDPPNEDDRVPFTLMSFGAFLSPPYTDLYDFSWTFDGQPLQLDASAFLYQVPVEALPKTPGNQHTVKVTAIGARYYPDPSLTHLPPTLTVSCSFKTSVSPTPPATGGTGPASGANPPGDGTGTTGGTTTQPSTGAGGTGPPGTVVAAPVPTTPPISSSFVPDYDLVTRCKVKVGVVGAYSSKQQFDDVISCYVQGAIAAGSTQSPSEVEQNIRRALAF